MRIILLVITLTFYSSLSAQTNKYTGTFKAIHNFNESGVIEYTLVLNPNGTFTFHDYRKISHKNPEENSFGKGTWKVEKDNTLYFYTELSTDINNKYTLDFTNTKARYHTKSPRDKTDKMVITKLHFYDSEIPWLKGWKLFKI